MNTHILIPIKDIEERLNLYSKAVAQAAQDKDQLKYTKFVGKYFGVDGLYELGKQISLDEKDIEEKALKVYPLKNEVDYDTGVVYEGNRDNRIAYKQALKDLI